MGIEKEFFCILGFARRLSLVDNILARQPGNAKTEDKYTCGAQRDGGAPLVLLNQNSHCITTVAMEMNSINLQTKLEPLPPKIQGENVTFFTTLRW